MLIIVSIRVIEITRKRMNQAKPCLASTN